MTNKIAGAITSPLSRWIRRHKIIELGDDLPLLERPIYNPWHDGCYLQLVALLKAISGSNLPDKLLGALKEIPLSEEQKFLDYLDSLPPNNAFGLLSTVVDVAYRGLLDKLTSLSQVTGQSRCASAPGPAIRSHCKDQIEALALCRALTGVSSMLKALADDRTPGIERVAKDDSANQSNPPVRTDLLFLEYNHRVFQGIEKRLTEDSQAR
jgi:hypothetical protein